MTTFSKAEIADLAVHQITDPELEEAGTAFNGFSSIYGRRWIDEYFGGAQIPGYVRRIMGLWRDYSLIRKLPRSGEITERWRSGINENGVATELSILADVFRTGVELELFPPILGRVPDARIRLSQAQPWTYVEASQRAMSKIQRDSEAAMQRIVAKARDALPTVHSKFAILRLPTELEIQRIIDWLCSRPESGAALEDLVMLWIESLDSAVGVNDELCEHVPEPRLFMTQVAGGKPLTKATVAMRIEDRGAAGLLEEEAGQLPSSEPGMVIIDTSRVLGGPDAWEPLICRRLQPSINTRIGAVILTRNLYGAKGRESESITITNCHAATPIDSALLERLKGGFPANTMRVR